MKNMVITIFLITNLLLVSCNNESTNLSKSTLNQDPKITKDTIINGCIQKQGGIAKNLKMDDIHDCYIESLEMYPLIELCQNYYKPVPCFGKLAIVLNDVNICKHFPSSISDIYNPNYCITLFAWNSKDTKICDQVESISFRRECYATVAARLNDLEVCNTFLPNTAIYDGEEYDYVKSCKNSAATLLSGESGRDEYLYGIKASS